MPADAWLGSPLLAGLDARGRADLRAAGRVRRLDAGSLVFAVGDPADSLWFVASGSILLETKRGARELGASEHFGGEALVRGALRAGRALARVEGSAVEVPVTALQRILARSGGAVLLAREAASARNQAFSALLAGTPFGQALGERALDELVLAAREESRAPGSRLFDATETARAAFIVVSGLVELVADAEEKSFAARGDVLGVEATRGSEAYGARATALGEVVVLSLPSELLAELAARHPSAIARAESAARARREKQRRIHELSAEHATRHAIHELERLQSARSLLAIDLGSCVRCGQCSSACADTHGTPRLERRGEKAVLALPSEEGLVARALLFPHACHHCKDPVCLTECPTGAISRDAIAGVVLEEDLCTGCGACAKACPWDAIRMAPRAFDSAGAEAGAAVVATKCDLCHGGDGPECVGACPTNAIFRLDPERDLVEVRSLLGSPREPAQAARRTIRSGARGLAFLALIPPLIAFGRSGLVAPSETQVWVTGALAGVLTLLLLAHGVIKRVRRLRAWLSKRVARGAERGGLRPFVTAHAVTGLFAAASVLAHTGARASHGVAGTLTLVFWLLAASGGLGALAYRALPQRLSRLERRGSLPEDQAEELEELRQKLYGRLSERSSALKELARRVLVPYSGAWYGPLALVASGRSIGEEEAALAVHVERLLFGRKSERLLGADELARAAVAIRALGARRLLEATLSAWLPLHVVLSALLLVLLALHVVGAVR